MGGHAEDSEKRDIVPKDEDSTNVMEQVVGIGIRHTWVSPTSSLTSCVTSGNILNLSEPHFYHFLNTFFDFNVYF